MLRKPRVKVGLSHPEDASSRFTQNGGVFIHQTTRNDVSKECNLGLNSLTGLGGRCKRITDWAEINDLHIKRLFSALCKNTARKYESERPAGLQTRYVPTVPSHFTTPKLNSLLLRPYLHDTC